MESVQKLTHRAYVKSQQYHEFHPNSQLTEKYLRSQYQQ